MTLLEEELKLAVSKNHYLTEKSDINLDSLYKEKVCHSILLITILRNR